MAIGESNHFIGHRAKFKQQQKITQIENNELCTTVDTRLMLWTLNIHNRKRMKIEEHTEKKEKKSFFEKRRDRATEREKKEN